MGTACVKTDARPGNTAINIEVGMTEEVTKETLDAEIAAAVHKAIDANVKFIDIIAVLVSNEMSISIIMHKSAEEAGII